MWLDIPSTDGFALLSARPIAGVAPGVEIAFTIDRDAPGDLTLIDIAGRVQGRAGLAGLGAGSHTLRLGSALAPGMYFVRLAHGGRIASAKVVATR